MLLSHRILFHALISPLLTLAQTDSCSDSCYDYNSILESCQSDAGQEDVYKSCVCNDANFQTYVQPCVDCEGTGSAPYQFQQNCKSVPPDCTIACSQFGTILSSCGDPSSSGYEACVCGSAYDEQYTTTFNQAFNDCVTCENGGGQAADWEARCCAAGHGCVGANPQASGEATTLAATMVSTASATVLSTAPATVASTSSYSAPTASTSGGSSSHEKAPRILGLAWVQLLLGLAYGTL